MAKAATSAAALMLLLSLAMWAMPRATADCNPVCDTQPKCPSTADALDAVSVLRRLPSYQMCCQVNGYQSGACSTMVSKGTAVLYICGLSSVCIPCRAAARVLGIVLSTCGSVSVNQVCGSYTSLNVTLRIRHASP